MGVRRVVTGHDPNGKSVFASDAEVEPVTLALMPGYEFYRLWGADRPCRFPGDGSPPSAHDYFPPLGGFRVAMFTLPPDSTPQTSGLDVESAMAELHRKLPGLGGVIEPDGQGMHTTATVDFEFIVSGRCVLELDDGATRQLGPGDTVVQNGTRHAWRNPFDEPCVVVVMLVGAEHDRLGGR